MQSLWREKLFSRSESNQGVTFLSEYVARELIKWVLSPLIHRTVKGRVRFNILYVKFYHTTPSSLIACFFIYLWIICSLNDKPLSHKYMLIFCSTVGLFWKCIRIFLHIFFSDNIQRWKIFSVQYLLGKLSFRQSGTQQIIFFIFYNSFYLIFQTAIYIFSYQ